MWGLGLCLVSVLGLSCASKGSSIPLGDGLDDLLNTVSDPHFFDEQVIFCVRALGLDPTPLVRLGTGGQVLRPAIADEDRASSGIAAAAIASLDSVAVANEPPTIPQSLQQALSGPVLTQLSEYADGCEAFAQRTLDATPSEVLRLDLNRRYVDTVGLRMFADQRWIAINDEWAKCMAVAGFGSLREPGDQLGLVRHQVELAGDDRQLLTSALRFDERATSAAQRCISEDGRRERQVAIRVDYERRFVSNNRSDLERLILLVDEAQRGQVSGDETQPTGLSGTG